MNNWCNTRAVRYIRYMFDFITHILPVDKNQVMFLSFEGQYNDNPKYISEKLHEMYPETRIVWVVSSKCHELDSLPEYINTVKFNSFKAVYFKNRSKVLIDNSVGWYIVRIRNKWLKSHIKRDCQLNLSTYHGTILKKGGADYDDGSKFDQEECVTISDVVIAGNYYNADRLKACYFDDLSILLTGMPRNDILFNQDIDVKGIRSRLHLPIDWHLVLYAPSWRKNVEDAGIKQLKMMDVDRLLGALGAKFGGKWKMVFRAHNLVLKKLDKEVFLSGSVFDGNVGDDMAEYIKACDVIISDFSGCLFDVALTDKPCFFFAHDVDNYINNERGVYFDLKELPYSVSRSFEELMNNISSYNYSYDISKRKELLVKLGDVENGNASEKIVSIIHDFMVGKVSKRDIIEKNREMLFDSYKGGLI